MNLEEKKHNKNIFKKTSKKRKAYDRNRIQSMKHYT